MLRDDVDRPARADANRPRLKELNRLLGGPNAARNFHLELVANSRFDKGDTRNRRAAWPHTRAGLVKVSTRLQDEFGYFLNGSLCVSDSSGSIAPPSVGRLSYALPCRRAEQDPDQPAESD